MDCLPAFASSPKSQTGLADQPVKEIKHCREEQKHRAHTDDRSTRHQKTQRTDHIDLRIHTDSEGCRKKAESRHHDCSSARSMGDPDRFVLTFSRASFLFVTAGHQNRIIYCRAQLDCADHDGGNKRKRRSRDIRNSHIDENRTLNDQHQDKRQRNRFKHK